ncbi:MAG: hypothetical protein AABN33_27605 [Acidobacteriota bacterium]
MRIKMTTTLFLLLCLALVVPSLATSGVKKDKKDSGKETFSALAELPVAGSTINVTIYINRYSSEQDAKQMHAILLDGGPKALLKTLQKMKPIGRIEKVGTVGFYDFKFILSTPTATGRRIYAVTDRPIGFLEAYYDTRSKDYPFGIMQLELKANEKGKQKGEGTLIYAAQIKVLDGEKVEIENLTFAPIRLLGVRQL